MISMPVEPPITFELRITSKLRKDFHAALKGCERVKPIKRTRKRQIARARHMMAQHDHTSYEWSQWWRMPARKPKRWKK